MTGQELTKARKALRYTQSALAKQLNVNRTTLWNWETGKHPVPASIKQAIEDLRIRMVREIGKGAAL